MENVTRRAVVNYNYFLQVPSQLVQVLNVIATVVHARLAEKPRAENVPPKNCTNVLVFGRRRYVNSSRLLVKKISDGIGVFC